MTISHARKLTDRRCTMRDPSHQWQAGAAVPETVLTPLDVLAVVEVTPVVDGAYKRGQGRRRG